MFPSDLLNLFLLEGRLDLMAACVKSLLLFDTCRMNSCNQPRKRLTLTYCLWFQTALCHWGPTWAQASPTGPLWAWWLRQFHSAGRRRWRSPTGERSLINSTWPVILTSLVSSTLHHCQTFNLKFHQARAHTHKNKTKTICKTKQTWFNLWEKRVWREWRRTTSKLN